MKRWGITTFVEHGPPLTGYSVWTIYGAMKPASALHKSW